MDTLVQPALESLRTAQGPGFLWDPLRHRVAWANPAALKLFGCETQFDLIERPFDAAEPGVVALRNLSAGSGGRHVRLEFPSADPSVVIDATVTPQALADGRIGLLVAGQPPSRASAVAAAFELHTSPMFIIDAQGEARDANRAAFDLLPGAARWSLAGLTGSDKAAESVIRRLDAVSVVSSIHTVDTRIGRRDLRITARKLDGQDGFALVVLEDVTDRRSLERRLAEQETGAPARPPEPVLTVPEEPSPAPPPPAPRLVAPPPAPPAPPQGIPDFIRQKLDSAAGVNVFIKNNELIHANPAALTLLRYDSIETLRAGTAVIEALGGAGVAARLPTGDGAMIDVLIERNAFPWIGGPGIRCTLQEMAEETAPEPKPEPAPPTAQIIELPFPKDPAPLPVIEPPPAPPALDPPARRMETALPPFPRFDDATPLKEITRRADEAPPRPAPAPIPPPSAQAEAPRIAGHEDELRAILDTVADGIITLDQAGDIQSFSAGAESIFGFRTAEVLDRPLTSLLTPESRKDVRDYLASLLEPGLASLLNDGREVAAVEKNGGELPLFLTIGRMEAASGAPRFCAVVRDITQWKRAEAELRDARDAAEKTSRQKSEFLARISHELRTPLNAILGFSEVMRMERFGEIRNDRYRGYINDIHTSGSHLLSLINDLLDLSKVEAGKLELNFTAVNLGEVTDHAFKLLQEEAAAARVILRKNVPADLPNVVADLRSMRQILLNLVSNAIKFTDAGGQITVSAHTNGAGEMVLRIKDTGIGMNEDQLRDALEPFRRVTTDGREQPGTGLGLPLTRALAEANRTVFDITSEPRKGTVIELTFPTTRVLAS